MGKVRFNVSMSLDGYIAGPDQNEQDPLGKGGMDLHAWLFELEAWRNTHGEPGGDVNASTRVAQDLEEAFGAVVMGRNMFGPVRGPWGADPWKGWWGEDPPYHTPVFVLTHHQHAPLEMTGGTTFHFVTDGIESALRRARLVAGEHDVLIAGGANVINQYLNAGLIDDFWISVVPLVLGDGERIFHNLDASVRLEQLEAVEGTEVVHTKYAVTRS